MGFLRRSADREPVVVLSVALGVFGLTASAIGPPIRRGMGKDVRAYYGAPQTAAEKQQDEESLKRRGPSARAQRYAEGERARSNAEVGFWVKQHVGSNPQLLKSSDIDGGHVVRKSSVLIKD